MRIPRSVPRFNRRQHERFRLTPMYTAVSVEAKPRQRDPLAGHAYDISETGVRIELDEPLRVGQSITVHLELPGAGDEIHSQADVVWVNDEHDDPGPRRMALRFTDFKSEADRCRLCNYLGCGLQRLAA